MLKKTMTYTDFNGVTRTEDFWFNLSKAELMEMEIGVDGGLTEMVRKLVATKDVPGLAKIFKELVLKAYGEKSPDGKHFWKEDEQGRPLCKRFEQTQAYSDLYMELALDDKNAADFINGIVPEDVRQSAESGAAIAAAI